MGFAGSGPFELEGNISNGENDKGFIWEHLSKIFLAASEHALLDTIEAIASEAGVSRIEGFPVREFFERRKGEKSEHLVADFADTNPRMASEVKAAWDKLNREREDQSDS
jgi:hypothetical protein